MFQIDQLTVPIIAAPMAGGPSTPELVVAVSRAGGLGFLAGGYLTAGALADRIAATRRVTAAPFGVNLFCPPDAVGDLAAVRAYSAALGALFDRFGVDPPEPVPDDDDWDAKLVVLRETAPAVVSFTFGLPGHELVAELHERDICVAATVTMVEDAVDAAGVGVDVLVVQGPDAGGHQGSLRVADPANERPLPELLTAVRQVSNRPLVAAGGIATGPKIAPLLAAGAAAVQLGTAFLLTPEAGTSATVRAALTDPRFTSTALTRAFSGRLARGLRNDFVERYDALAPAAYPAVNQVTGPLRRAASAAGDAEHTHLWAGTGWRSARAVSAEDVVTDLWAAAR